MVSLRSCGFWFLALTRLNRCNFFSGGLPFRGCELGAEAYCGCAVSDRDLRPLIYVVVWHFVAKCIFGDRLVKSLHCLKLRCRGGVTRDFAALLVECDSAADFGLVSCETSRRRSLLRRLCARSLWLIRRLFSTVQFWHSHQRRRPSLARSVQQAGGGWSQSIEAARSMKPCGVGGRFSPQLRCPISRLGQPADEDLNAEGRA